MNPLRLPHFLPPLGLCTDFVSPRTAPRGALRTTKPSEPLLMGRRQREVLLDRRDMFPAVLAAGALLQFTADQCRLDVFAAIR